MRRAAKIDTAQPAIVEGLRARGYLVQSLAEIGRGCPDLLVKTPRGALRLLEVKSRGGTLTIEQEAWITIWQDVAIVHTLDEALAALEGT